MNGRSKSHVLVLIGSRRINTRMAMFIASILAPDRSVRILSLPRHAWSFASLESAEPMRTHLFNAKIGRDADGSRLNAIVCFHWIMMPLAVLWGKAKRVPVVYDEHDHYELNTLEGGGGRLIRRAIGALISITHRTFLPKASLVTCIHLKDEALKKHLQKRQPNVIELNNYPLAAWRGAASAQLPSAPLCFVYAGGVFEEKGVRAAALAAQDLIGLHPGRMELHVFGTGDTSIAAEFAGVAGLFFHGSVGSNEIRRFASSRRCCGLAMLRSSPRYDLAGTNVTKLYEYLAAGMPVIVSNVGEIGAFVEAAQVGLTVGEMLPTDEVKSAMSNMLLDEAAFDLRSERARTLMLRDDMTWEREWTKVAETRILSGGPT